MQQFEEAIAKALTDSYEKKLPEAVGLLLDARIKELGLDKVDRKFGMYPTDGEDEAKQLKKTKKERVAEFVKAVWRKDFQMLAKMNVKSMTEGTDSQGGFMVPEEFSSEVFRIVGDYGLVRKLSRVFPMRSDTYNIPTTTTSVTGYWPGEVTAITASTPVIGRAVLNAKTAAGITTMGKEFLADASVDVVDYLMELFAEELARLEDDQGLTGTGSPFTGVLGNASVNVVTAATGHDTLAELDLDDYRDCISQIKPSALRGAVWVMHRDLWALLQKKTENSQHVLHLTNPLITPGSSPEAISPVGTLWQYPVYLNDEMPNSTAASTKFVIFGNFRQGFFFGDRQQITMDIADQATVGSDNLWEKNMQGVRIAERVAMVLGLPTAFAVLKTAA